MIAYADRHIDLMTDSGDHVTNSGPPPRAIDVRTPRDRSFFRSFAKFISYRLARLTAVIWFTLCAASTVAVPGQASDRVALLLGAEKYKNYRSSSITAAQTSSLKAALEGQGFNVSVITDPTNASARAALTDFSRAAEAAEFALIVATGHFATYRRNSFFLPVNAQVRRATDLFSRSLSVANLADIAGRAKSGALLMVMTVADIPSTIAGISARPDFANSPPDNIVAVFSSSTKVPVSRVAGVSLQAMKDLVEAANEKPMTLAALVDSASAGGTGRVFGTPKELDLSKTLAKPARGANTQNTAREKALTEAERKARMLAEQRAKEAEARAREAEQRAKEAEQRAKQEQLAAARASAAAAAAAAKKETAPATQQQLPDATPPAAKTAAPDIQSLQVVEALLGRGQRKIIQRLLKDMGLYTGPIDAIFGDLTRDAIRQFQKRNGAAETGYLTPEQFQKLVASR